MLRTAALPAPTAALAAALAALTGFAAAPATAQSLLDDLGFEIGAGTDNRSKNASKTQGDAYAYGIVDWTPGGGDFYVSGSAEGVDGGGSDWETKLMAGWTPQFAGFDFDINVAHKWRVDAVPGHDDDSWEYTANVSRSIGPASARLQYQYSPDSLGATGSFSWVELRAGWAFTPRVRGTAAVGRREQRNAPDYTGWNLGATVGLTDQVDLDLRYYDTNLDIPGDRQYDQTVAARLSLSF